MNRFYKESTIEPMIGDIVCGIGINHKEEFVVSNVELSDPNNHSWVSNCSFNGVLTINDPESITFIRRGDNGY